MINLTPHAVVVRDAHGIDHVYQPSGLIARVDSVASPSIPLPDGTPTCTVKYGIASLPPIEPPEGVRIVTSSYYGSHPERGGRDKMLFVRATQDATVTAQHGDRDEYIVIDGFEFANADCDDVLSDFSPRYIVSKLFADAYRSQEGNPDIELFVPDSGPSAIRENGQIVAVRSLIRM